MSCGDAVQVGGQVRPDVSGEFGQAVFAAAGYHDGRAGLEEGAYDAFSDVAGAAGYDYYAVYCGW
ncbi:hypothetical protein Prum_072480 [Phytohabitans rumicis]|uniref:Uncharacterized protein n=1 Tax=Phytohabitans rumicis TaxID=1076125 RepID=A0A6V8LHL6_9ACTN|nr:hypothetical protein Prum_072480 [Phytohabitans rumicis]